MKLKTIKMHRIMFLLLLWSGGALSADWHYQLEVDGLACPFCAYGIEKQLSKLEGVEQLEVDIKTGQLLIRMETGVSLNKADAEQAVKKAGFSMRTFLSLKEPPRNGGQ